MDQPSKTPKIVGAFVVSAVLLIGAYVVLSQNSDDTETTTTNVVVTSDADTSEATETAPDTEETVETQQQDQTEDETGENDYQDGTFSAEGTYQVPSGDNEPISVSVTLEDDVITGLTVDTVATNPTSVRYQDGFDAEVQGAVEGEDIDDVDLFRLGGASLTSDAFNDLLDGIRNAARS